MKTYLLVGGLVAVGFDSSGDYLLAISHSGRGVFATTTWQKVARHYDLAYPESGKAIGIGPIEGQVIAVTELNLEGGITRLLSSDGRFCLECESDGITVGYR